MEREITENNKKKGKGRKRINLKKRVAKI